MADLLTLHKLEKIVLDRWSLTPQQSQVITIAAVALYILIFPSFYPVIDHAYFPLGIIPIVVAGLLLGLRIAIYVVLTISVAHFGILLGPLGYSPERAVIDSFPLVTLFIGITVGYLRDLRVELVHRTNELERRNEQLDQFAAVVSHDLQNPLHTAQGYLELAQQECDCECEHLDTVKHAHNRMNALVNDLLTLARQGATIDQIEPVDLAEVTEASWQHVETADASLAIETDQVIQADQHRLRQLLENLLRNAVEHGGENVTVRIGVLENGSGIYLEDDGPGIPEKKCDQIFTDGYSTRETGSGIGLTIVKQIVDAHRWDIRVTESNTGGARFEITGIDIDI
jgi:signal transduction histidine kinase